MIIKENINNVDEFNSLYDNVDWGSYDKELSQIALNNTLYSISVYDNKEIVGYGRIIGDGAIFFYIQDIMVKKEYQNKKIGTTIMNKLLEKISEYSKKNPDLLVYLGASKNKENFYKKFGFITRNEAGLGPGMVLK